MTESINKSATATGVLRREHELILGVAAALERMVDTTARGSMPDPDQASRFVSFIRLYADLCHHGKEESLLFPELERHGLPADEGPIAVMLHEHELGRSLVREMAGALDRASGGDAGTGFTEAARGYVDLIRDHISKEDTILFEMADNMIVGVDCRELCDRYAEVDQRLFEGRSKPDLEQLGAELVAV